MWLLLVATVLGIAGMLRIFGARLRERAERGDWLDRWIWLSWSILELMGILTVMCLVMIWGLAEIRK